MVRWRREKWERGRREGDGVEEAEEGKEREKFRPSCSSPLVCMNEQSEDK